jgi:hypothetical protein
VACIEGFIRARRAVVVGIAWAVFATLAALSHNPAGAYCDPTAPPETWNFRAGNGECRIRVAEAVDFFGFNGLFAFGLTLGGLTLPVLLWCRCPLADILDLTTPQDFWNLGQAAAIGRSSAI